MEGAVRLVSAPWVVPVAVPPLAEGALVLDDQGTILACGARAELRRRFAALPEERGEGALLPGLVNAHTHLELSFLGLVPGGEGLVRWAGHVMAQARPSEEARAAAALGAARAARAAGTAAVGDVGNGLGAVSALAEAGLEGVFFHELLGSREAATGDALADAERERATFASRTPWPARLRYVPAPHALYSVGPDLLRRTFARAAVAREATSIHVAEDADELALLRDGSGRWAPLLERLGVPPGERTPNCGPLPYLEALGAFAGPRPPLLVHMVHASADDRRIAREARAVAVLCPRSNLHIGGRLPDLPALLADGVPLALGTDSLASATDLSLWGELATLAEAHPAVPPAALMHAATAGGAEALGARRLGTFGEGQRPGVLDVALPSLERITPLATLVRLRSPNVRWITTP